MQDCITSAEDSQGLTASATLLGRWHMPPQGAHSGPKRRLRDALDRIGRMAWTGKILWNSHVASIAEPFIASGIQSAQCQVAAFLQGPNLDAVQVVP